MRKNKKKIIRTFICDNVHLNLSISVKYKIWNNVYANIRDNVKDSVKNKGFVDIVDNVSNIKFSDFSNSALTSLKS
jgi:hypothetical protein